MPRRKTKSTGKMARRKAGFKKDNIPHNKGTKSFKSAEPGTSSIPSSDMPQVNAIPGHNEVILGQNQEICEPASVQRNLRSLAHTTITPNPDATMEDQTRLKLITAGNRIVNVLKNAEMWNETFRQHKTVSPQCNGFLHWDIDREKLWGLSTEEYAVCTECDYQSGKYVLYEQVITGNRGRRAATINRGVHVGLSQVSMGPTGLQTVLNSCNIPAPSLSSMQKAANKVLPIIEEENEKDMQEILLEAEQHATNQGLPEKAMAFQVDGTYNNARYTGIGKTPFLPATQTSFVVAENVTPKRKIVGLITKNKLCSKGKLHTAEAELSQCGCKANITLQTNIGDEGSWAQEYFRFIKRRSNIEATDIISDPDTRCHKAVEELFTSGETSVKPRSHTDTRHLAQNHRKFIKKSKLLNKLMPGRTAAIREKQKNNFAVDLSKRCQAEFNAAYQMHNNTSALINKLSYASDAIVLCYQGNHSECKKSSFVCLDNKGRNWLCRSSFLNSSFKIDCKKTDSLLRIMVQYRLCRATVLKTHRNFNTQKVESMNRTIKRSLPARLTFTRNMSGRAHSAVHTRNNGPGDSLLKLCEVAGSPIAKSSTVWHQLKKQQRQHERQKQYKQSQTYKSKRAAKRTFLFKLYERFQECKKYKKGLALTPIANKLKEKYMLLDHCYSDVGRQRAQEHGYSKPQASTSKCRI